jgi:hypothetical protein
MAGKITLYVRDQTLWDRAKRASGRGGLSELVSESLRERLDRAMADSPSPLERARRLRQDADALVRLLEQQAPEGPTSVKPRRRTPRSAR